MSERVTIRLEDDVRSKLSEVAKARGSNLSSVVRQAVIAEIKGINGTIPAMPPIHDREACAQAILEGCPWDVRRELSMYLTTPGFSLVD